MGIRRRRKKLTSIITSVDRRLRSVEYRHVPTKIAPKSITTDQITDGTIPSSDPKDAGATGAISSDTTPVEFAVITAAAYSSRNVTGTVDRVDITTATDHGLSVGNKVTIYGLNNNDVNLDGTYVVTEAPTSTTLRFSRGLTGYYPSVINLAVSATVTSRFCSTTTATLTLSSTSHGFTVGEVITVSDVPTDDFFNGTFKITAVDGANISYNFESAQASVSVTSGAGYVKSVLHKYAIVGDTWIDTSVTPNTVKIWDGLKWTSPSSIPDNVIVDDGLAPKPPTGLSATQNGYYDSATGAAKIAVRLSWAAPTENTDNTELRDLAGYKVYYKYVAGVEETGSAGSGEIDTTTTNTDGTITGTFSYAPAIALVGTTVSFTTTAGTIQPESYAIPAGSSGKVVWTISGLSEDQEVTMNWSTPANGYGDITGTAGSTEVVSKHKHDASNFSYDIWGDTAITEATQPTTADPVGGGPVIAVAEWQDAGDTEQSQQVISGLNTGSNILFGVKAYDSSKKNYSAMSDELTVVTGKPALVLQIPSKPSVESRLGTVTVSWDGLDSLGNTPAPSLDYLEVHIGTTSGFTPSSSTLQGRIDPTNGYNSLVIPGLTYGTAYYAKLIAVSTNGASTNPSVASDSVTSVALVDTDVIGKVLSGAKIVDGSITASDAIIGNTITGNLIQANTIDAGSIKTNSLTADQIKAGALDAFLITGSNIQTAKPSSEGGQNARIVMNSGGITAYNTSGSQTFNINANTGVVTANGYLTTGSAASDVNNNTTTISGGKITSGTIEASKILVTDTFYYYNSNTDYSTHIGRNSITGEAIDSSGISFKYQGNAIGYLGGWSPGGIELGTSFSSNYIDMYTYNYASWVSSSGISLTSDENISIGSSTVLDLSGNTGTNVGWGGDTIIYGVLKADSAYLLNTGTQLVPNMRVDTDGKIHRTSHANSSLRYKSDIRSLEFDTKAFMSLRPVLYKFNPETVPGVDTSIDYSGFIAEDVDALGLRELIDYDKENRPDALRYDRFVVYLHAVLKEQAKKIEELEKKVGIN